jgi:hypothetical protein
MRHIMCVNSGDDGIDYDEGYRGKMQFVFVMQGVPTGEVPDKAGEHDGGNGPDNSRPKSIPTIANATYIGLGGTKNYTTPAVAAKDLNVHFRDDAGGRYYDSFFGDFGGATMMIEGGDLPGGSQTATETSGERAITAYGTGLSGYCRLAPATACTTSAVCGANGPCVLHYQGPSSDFELEFRDNSFWCFGQFDTNSDGTVDVPSGEQSARDGDANKNHYGYPAFSTASLQNQYLRCADPLPIRHLTRGSASPASNPDPVTGVDPRPTPGGPLYVQPKYTDTRFSSDGFFQPTSYRGAFGGTNWADGWTAVSLVGYFPVCDALHPGAVPDETSNLVFQNKTTLAWDDVTFNRTYFDVLRSTKGSDFSSSFAICFEAHDTDLKANDSAVPSTGSAFFYLVRAGNPCGKGTLGQRSSGVERVSDLSCP